LVSASPLAVAAARPEAIPSKYLTLRLSKIGRPLAGPSFFGFLNPLIKRSPITAEILDQQVHAWPQRNALLIRENP
jgi:hypothetical protein